MFLAAVLATIVGIAVLAASMALAFKPLARLVVRVVAPEVRHLVESLLDQTAAAYGKNPMGLLPVTEKITPLGLLETRIRVHTGQPPARPLGSPVHFSPWDEVLLNFSNVDPMPTPEADSIHLGVTIGPAAKRPLKVQQPVLITAMSFGGALSLKARLALAKASTVVGTAVNSGEGVFLPEERKLAEHYVVQYHRGTWPNSPQFHPEVFEQADAIEIQLGQGAQGGAPTTTLAEHIHPEMRRRYGLKEGEPAEIASRLYGIESARDLIRLIRDLREQFSVPVGVKFGATGRMEREMAVYLEAGVDFLTVDGAEGGTHGGPPILQDAMGLPTLWAIARARHFLEQHDMADQVSLIATGGLIEPGHFLKAIALGATACYSGSAVVIALLSEQMSKAFTDGAPPYALILQSTRYLNDELDDQVAADGVARLFQAWHEEWGLALRAMGKHDLKDLGKGDLVAQSKDLAHALRISHVAGPLLYHQSRTLKSR